MSLSPNFQKKRIFNLIIGSLLLFGISVNIYGFWKMFAQKSIPWDNNKTLLLFYGFLFFNFLGVFLLGYLLKNIPLGSIVLILLISIITSKIWYFVAVVWIILSAIIIGSFILKKIQIRSNWLDSFLVGIGILGTIIGLTAHIRINYSGLYAIVLTLICLLGRNTAKEVFEDIKVWQKNYLFPASVVKRILGTFLFTLGITYFVFALMPELGHDGLAMHLFIPAKLATNHEWNFDVNKYVWAVMPLLANWIYSLGYMIGGETSARLINVCFIFVLALLLKRISKWASDSSNVGNTACAIFLSSPLTFGVGSNLLVEPVWSAFALGSLAKFLEFNAQNDSEDKSRELIVIGGLMGFAVASKLIAFMTIPLFLLVLLLNYRFYFKRQSSTSIFAGIFSFSLFGCIPYLTAWILTGNPVFPFFNKFFQSPLWLNENFTDSRWVKPVTIDFLYSLTFETSKYLEALPGAAGFQWLFFLPLCFIVLLLFRHRKGLLLLALGISFILLVYNSTIYLRYIFPAYSLLCVVIAVGLGEIQNFSKILYSITSVILGVVLFLNVTFLSSVFFVYQDFPITSILSEDSRRNYLSTGKPIRNIVEITNNLNLKQKPVAILSEPFGAQIKSDVLYTNWYNRKWQQSFSELKNEQEMTNLFAEYRIEYLIIDDSFSLPEEKIKMLENLTDKITQISQIQLRRVKPLKSAFIKELLTDSDLTSSEGWQIPQPELYNQSSKTVVVDEKLPVVQRVKVKPDFTYLAKVSSKCYSDFTQGRVQVNWQDEKGKFIKADIKVFDCTTNWNENSMEVIAPSDATFADFYLTSHTNLKILINGASFRE
jgi:hypothetical protein